MRDLFQNIKVLFLLIYWFGFWDFLLIELGMKEWILSVFLMTLFGILLSFWYLKKAKALSIFSIKIPKLPTIIQTILIGLGIIVLQRMIIFLSTGGSGQSSNIFLEKVGSSGETLFFLLLLIDFCVTGPIFEEIFCRSVLMTHFFKDSKYYLDVFLSAIIFSLAHLDLSYFRIINFLYFLVPGIGLGILYRRTKSIYPSLLIHCAWNTYVNWPYIEIFLKQLVQ